MPKSAVASHQGSRIALHKQFLRDNPEHGVFLETRAAATIGNSVTKGLHSYLQLNKFCYFRENEKPSIDSRVPAFYNSAINRER
jgi:hypothetical protein